MTSRFYFDRRRKSSATVNDADSEFNADGDNRRHYSRSEASDEAMYNAKHFNSPYTTSSNLQKKTGYAFTRERLDFYYGIVKRQLMWYQDEASGLFRSQDKGSDVAHLRDSIYAAAALWALSIAYKKIDDDNGRTRELAQCAVKAMRRILNLWMRETDRLEKFKNNQAPENALHVKYNIKTFTPIKNESYPHLQMDVVGLYLIYLVQMIESGIQIIYTLDEVCVIQNLVFYIERAYRTPDFGMWERGTKYNDGSAELHSSSIGAAKVALECINGFNLFGNCGSSWSVVYVDVDAHNRNRTILESLLPRESSSKNTDASLLSTLSYPVFAMHKPALFKRTVEKVRRKLIGKYGFKRFLRDGYGHALEKNVIQPDGLYKPESIQAFENTENQWPVFFAFLIIDGVFHNDVGQVQQYQKMLEPLLKETSGGDIVIPKYYYIPEIDVEEAKEDPRTHARLSVCNDPDESGELFIWGQAVFIISQILVEKLIHPNELDPLRRYLPASQRHRKANRYSAFCGTTASDLAVQIALVSESTRLQQLLATYGIPSQTPTQLQPINVLPQTDIVRLYCHLGVNRALRLNGRPSRPFGALSTSKVYRACGITAVCYPLIMDISDFYLSFDKSILTDDIRASLAFVSRRWRLYGRPTMIMYMREDNFKGSKGGEFLELLSNMRLGDVNGVRVKLGALQNFIASSCIEHLDFANNLDMKSFLNPIRDKTEVIYGSLEIEASPSKKERKHTLIAINTIDYEHRDSREVVGALANCNSVKASSELLEILLKRHGKHFVIDAVSNTTVENRLNVLIAFAAAQERWQVVRFCSGILNKVVASLAPSITSALVRGKWVTIGPWDSNNVFVITKPITPKDLVSKIYSTSNGSFVDACLQQEILIAIGKLIESYPKLFDGIMKIHIGGIIHAINLYLDFVGRSVDGHSVYDESPSDVQNLMVDLLCIPVNVDDLEGAGYYEKIKTNEEQRFDVEASHPLSFGLIPHQKRQIDGCLKRVPQNFYDRCWKILKHCKKGIKVHEKVLLPQPTLSVMTLTELQFAMNFDDMLDKIPLPEHRQLIVELLVVIHIVLERFPESEFKDVLDTDALVESALRRFILHTQKNDIFVMERALKRNDWLLFYNQPLSITGNFLGEAATHSVIEQLRLQPDVMHRFTQERCILN